MGVVSGNLLDWHFTRAFKRSLQNFSPPRTSVLNSLATLWVPLDSQRSTPNS
jgi:hypothetical protein